jgi:small subunit ribosomal protein S19e
MQQDWWYSRAASLLRRMYIDGPVGISRLRSFYGGRQHRGQAPEHFRKSGGKVIRVVLQQLERAGLMAKTERKGRKLTPKGVKMVESLAQQIRDGKA